jgi:hypothetical protein
MQQIFAIRKHSDYYGKADRHLSICMSTLIEKCQQRSSVRRPTSIQILDQLKRYTEPQSHRPHWLLSDAFASLVRWRNPDGPNLHADGGDSRAQPDVLCTMLLKGYSDIDFTDPEAEHLMLEVRKFIERHEEGSMVSRTTSVPLSIPSSHLAVAKRIKSVLQRASKKKQLQPEHDKQPKPRNSRAAFSMASQFTSQPVVAGPSSAPRPLLDYRLQGLPQAQAFGSATSEHKTHDISDNGDKHNTLNRPDYPRPEGAHGRIQIISTSSLLLALLSLLPSPALVGRDPSSPVSYIPQGRHTWSNSTRSPNTTMLGIRLGMATAFVFVALAARYWRHPVRWLKEDIVALCDQLQIGTKRQNRIVIQRSGQRSTDSPWLVAGFGCERSVRQSSKRKHSMARVRICIGFNEALFRLKARSHREPDIEMDIISKRI